MQQLNHPPQSNGHREDRLDRLENVVHHIGNALLATTQAVQNLAMEMDALSHQIQKQGQQFQQQGYQVFAITDAVQVLLESQAATNKQLSELMITLTRLSEAIERNRT